MRSSLVHFKSSAIAVAAALVVAASMVIIDSKPANASSFYFGFGNHGPVGGVIVRHKSKRRHHCHGSYCHRHRNRGYHSHRRGRVKIYPPHTAPRYYRYRGHSAHVAWCLNRYRSYDIHSDTFQPYHGPRKRCNSPYDGY